MLFIEDIRNERFMPVLEGVSCPSHFDKYVVKQPDKLPGVEFEYLGRTIVAYHFWRTPDYHRHVIRGRFIFERWWQQTLLKYGADGFGFVQAVSCQEGTKPTHPPFKNVHLLLSVECYCRP